jgi:WD40 repeat protein
MNDRFQHLAVTDQNRLKEILLGNLRRMDVNYWPGVDEMNIDLVLECYIPGADAGQVPGREELLSQHPKLAAELETFFKASQSPETRVANVTTFSAAMHGMNVTVAIVCCWLCSFNSAAAEDWPMLGRDGTRNPVSLERGGPTAWSVEHHEEGRLVRETRGVRWIAPLGLSTFSSPVIANGLVWIGTFQTPGSQQDSTKNTGLLKCFRVADGKQVYEFVSPPLANRYQDTNWHGLGSSPLIEGDRLWLATNRGEVHCMDIGPLIRAEGPPREVWKLDLIKTFEPFQRSTVMGPPRPCSIGASWNGRIFVTINNGVGDDFKSVPKPDAPSLVCLNKETGEVHWKDNSPGSNILLTQFASPTVAEIAGHVQVIVPQSDGWVRAFDPQTGAKLWEFDVNLKTSYYALGSRDTRNSLLANAVVYEERVYIGSGRDIEQGDGPGRLVCIDPTKRGDVSSELAVDANNQPLPRRRLQAVNLQAGEIAIPNPNSALVWDFSSASANPKGGKVWEDHVHRMLGSVAISKGLVIAADIAGVVHCFDAKSGKHHWGHDTLATIWSAPLIVDDKIYIGNDDGDVVIYRLTPEPHAPLAVIPVDSGIFGSLAFSNGTLFVASQHKLLAITGDKVAEAKIPAVAGHWTQWRGPNRDNVSTDTGLLKQWPVAGPPLLWRLKGLGDGISPVSIAGGRIFALSQYEGTEFVRAIDERSGEELWTVILGTALRLNPLMRWYTQRPVTIDGEYLYGLSSAGDLICLRTTNGREVWRGHYPTNFEGKPTVFGFADCPVVDGDQLICTPGGADAAVVALNKRTGVVLWKCAIPDIGTVTFANGVVVTIEGRRQFITSFQNGLVGIDVRDGKLLWRYNGSIDLNHTPLVRDHLIACLNDAKGFKRLEVKILNGDFEVKEVDTKPFSISRIQDDTVILGDKLYEPNNGIFSCFDWKAGAVVWQKRMGPTFSSSFADGHFYFHTMDGQVQLVDPGPLEPAVKSQFLLPDHRSAMGTTTPIITGGRLYIREDEQLFCYDVRAESTALPTTEAHTITLAAPPAQLLIEHQNRTFRSVYVPTPQDIVEQMLEMSGVKQTDVVFDLGSGDGRIVNTAAKKYGSRSVGYELNKELVTLSREKAKAAGVEKLVTIESKDLVTADLTGADVLAVFLLPQQLEKLLPQLEKMKPGSRLVSHQFEIPGIAPDKTVRINSTEDSQSHVIHLWTLPLPKLAATRTFSGYQGEVFGAVFSPDAKLMASSGDDGTVRLWDVKTCKQLASLEGHTCHIPSEGCTGYVRGPLFSPDGNSILTMGRDGTTRLWDTKSFAIRITCQGSTQPIHSAVFASDGKSYATGDKAGLIRVWDVMTGKQISVCTGHQSEIHSLAFSPDSKRLASACGGDGTVRTWNPETGMALRSWMGHQRGFIKVWFSPNGKKLLAANLFNWVTRDFNEIRCWDNTQDQEEPVVFSGDDTHWVTQLADGQTFLTAGFKTPTVTMGAYKSDAMDREPISFFAISPDEKFVATMCYTSTEIRIWRIRDQKLDLWVTLKYHAKPLTCLAFSPDSSSLLSTSKDGTAKLWDLGQPARKLEKP